MLVSSESLLSLVPRGSPVGSLFPSVPGRTVLDNGGTYTELRACAGERRVCTVWRTTDVDRVPVDLFLVFSPTKGRFVEPGLYELEIF